ncbi:MRN complex-interacting protein isoform X1 [Elephas maximus indicus]|uniref:MRN complex-interacting protein isoform X1 n=1 Tax=Elephas maximus indicus TaxID=99487 RepID=UPI002116EB19|nr:MRN complex-interacting protein isoform X1 [Elephas maximus indicus]
MAPPQPARVLRCCSCRLFQAHQMKKSLKWTCKACGEKQSFLRAYGEGSGADCRRHVQKLNLLQGQVSEMLLRSVEEPVNASEEESAGHQQAENVSLQERSQPTESRWLKYLGKGSNELELEGEEVFFNRQSSSRLEKPDRPFSNNLPRKRKWSPDAQDSGSRESDSEVTLQPQKGYASLTGKVKQGSRGCLQENLEDWKTSDLTVPQWKPPRPAQQAKAASSKWERFLLSPGKSSHVDTEPPRLLQTGPTSASPSQPEPCTQSPREGHPSGPPGVLQVPWVPHAPTSGARRPCRTAEQPWGPGAFQVEGGPLVKVEQQPPPVLLCDLFKTDEDFDDDL